MEIYDSALVLDAGTRTVNYAIDSDGTLVFFPQHDRHEEYNWKLVGGDAGKRGHHYGFGGPDYEC